MAETDDPRFTAEDNTQGAYFLLQTSDQGYTVIACEDQVRALFLRLYQRYFYPGPYSAGTGWTKITATPATGSVTVHVHNVDSEQELKGTSVTAVVVDNDSYLIIAV